MYLVLDSTTTFPLTIYANNRPNTMLLVKSISIASEGGSADVTFKFFYKGTGTIISDIAPTEEFVSLYTFSDSVIGKASKGQDILLDKTGVIGVNQTITVFIEIVKFNVAEN